MTDFAKLSLSIDATGMAAGEQALDNLARTGARVEGTLKLNTKGIEQAMAALGNVMGGLGGTMKSLEAAMAKSMGGTVQAAQAGVRSFDDLRRSIDPAFAASQRFGEVQRELAGFVAMGAASQDQANQILDMARSRYLGVATAAEAAEQAQRAQAQAVATATGNYQSLRASIDPVYASSKRYEQAQLTLTAAVKQGVISQREMNSVLTMAERQMLAPANNLKKLGGAATDATKGLARFAPQLTNVGFQIQDFAVQVASGQSAVTAFTQQFPQLAGALGFSGKLALIGAGLGTFVAVGMAIAPLLIDMSSAAKRAEKSIDGLREAVGLYNQFSSVASQSQTDLAAKFGIMAGSAQAANETLAAFARIDAIEAMNQAVKDLTGRFGGLSDNFVSASVGGVMREWQETAANLASELNLTDVQANKVVVSLARFQTAATLEDQIAAAILFKEQMIETFGSIEKMPKEMREVTKGVLMLAAAGAEIVDPLDRANQEYDRMAAAAAGVIGQYDRQAAMSQSIAQFGADSAQVEALKRDEAMRTAQALLEQHDISGPLADQLMRSAGAAFDAANGAEAAAVSLRNAEAAARALASAMAAASGFTVNLEQQGWVLDAQIKAQIEGVDAAMAGMVAQRQMQASGLRDAAIEAANGEMILIRAANDEYAAQMRLIDANAAKQAQIQATAEAQREAAKAGRAGASEAEKASKKAAKEAEKASDALDKEAQKWTDILDPVSKYRREMGELAELQGRLSGAQMAEAQRRLNVELADSLPLAGEFVDTMSSSLLNGFSGALDSMGDALKNWLANAIAMAAKNRIVLSMGLGGGGMGAATAAAAGPMGGVSGAGGILGGLGAFGGGLLSGASGFATALTGGLGSAMQYTSLMAGGATSGLAGLGSALGAIALPIAAVAGLFSFFSKKTKQLDAGLRVTVDGFETMMQTFNRTETKRFWGLSKKTRTSYGTADQETQDALSRAVGTLQEGVMDAAKVLGFGAATFADFAHVMQISTKGMSRDDALRAVQDAIDGLGDSFAGMVPGLEGLIRDGETATTALSRLSQSLTGVNAIMDTLRHTFRAVGLSGAETASLIADAFGGLDAMTQATQRFYSTFYSEQERLETTTRQTTAALAKLGLAMPATRDEYRRMVSALDLTTERGREAYAALIGMSEAFDMILPQIASLTAELAALQGSVQTGLDRAISAAEDAASANSKAASDWYKAAGSIREYMDKLRGSASALFSPQQALRYNRGQYQATLMQAQAGDLTATQNIGGVADRYLTSVLETARTREEAAMAQARVMADLGLMQGVADIEGARHDVISGLIGQQVTLMREARDFLAAGNAMTEQQVADLMRGLGALDEGIAAAELINYQYLRDRLAVTVDVLADATIPEYLRTLLSNATNGVQGFVDFIVRSDLTPDLKWLALAGSSEHLKTVSYLAQNNLGADYTRLALQAGSGYQVSVQTALAQGGLLDVPQLRRLLTGSATGHLTLGGSFRFDPSTGFATWYETASRTAISNPMTTLRDAMGVLRGSLDELRNALIARVPPPVVGTPNPRPTAPTGPAPTPTAPAGRTLADYRMASTSWLPVWSTRNEDRQYGVMVTGPNGGQRRFDTQAQAQSWLATQNYPAFAAGGSHRGGVRLVGEQGPELEVTGPSRIYSAQQTRQMLSGRDDDALVAEVRALRQELAEVTMWSRKTAESTTDAKKDLREMNRVGVKIDPDQNKVSA